MPVRRIQEVTKDAPLASDLIEEVKSTPVKTVQELASEDLLFDVIWIIF